MVLEDSVGVNRQKPAPQQLWEAYLAKPGIKNVQLNLTLLVGALLVPVEWLCCGRLEVARNGW